METTGRELIDIVEGYMEGISNFIISSEKSRAHSEKQYKLAEGKIAKLSEFKLMMDGLLLTVSKNFYTPPKELNDNISYQIGLCASFLRTHFVINNLIYIQ